MITTVAGRAFLKAFNEEGQSCLSAREFFEKHYFKLFFDHPKYMQWITNSPFVQMKSGQKPHLLTAAQRLEKLGNLHQKIGSGSPDASIAIGYPASEEKEYASTSGLVSDLPIATSEEDIYLSWIGSGLGLTVAGGYSILFNQQEVLLDIYKGWKHYRKFLNDPSLALMRENQVNTWNAQWLAYYYDTDDYREQFDFSRLQSKNIFGISADKIEVNTIAWSRLFFRIAQKFHGQTFVGYVYSHGQTNKTVGFIPFHFKSGNRLVEVYRQLFDPENRVGTKDFEGLFGLHIKRACEFGSIGLHALRPEKLKKYFADKKTAFNKPEEIPLYHAFKTWLVAMLSKNKEELLDHTSAVAVKLIRYRKEGSKTDRKNLVEEKLLGTRHQKTFLEGLTSLIKDVCDEDLSFFRDLRNETYLMTAEEFGYFAALLKFDYYMEDRKA